MTRYPKGGKGSKWTVAELKAIDPSWNGDTLTDGNGLYGQVRMNNSGVVSIQFKYAFKWQGKLSWYYCGTFPNTDLTSIRTNRDCAKRLTSERIDPRVKKRTDRIEAQERLEKILANDQKQKAENLSVNDLFQVWIEDGINRADGNKYVIQAFKKHVLPAIGVIALRNLTENHLREIYRSIIHRGNQTRAVELSKDVRQMLRWAEKRKPWRSLLAEGNPSDLVDVSKLLSFDYTKERDRVLSEIEILQLHTVFKNSSSNYKSAPRKFEVERPLKYEVQKAVWICLSTLCRIGELLVAEWSHVNFEERTWTIPKENTKGERGKKRNHVIYLSDFAMYQFSQLWMCTGHSKWLFPARYIDGHVCIKSASKQIGDRQLQFKSRSKKLKFRVENNSLVIGDREWTPHDLRRTGATLMQKLKISRDVINLCQNHIIGSKVDRHYLHHDYAAEKREAWELLGSYIERILDKPLENRIPA